MNPIKKLIEKIKNFRENRKIKKLPNKEVLSDLKRPAGESIIPEAKVPFAIEYMEGEKGQVDALKVAIDEVPEQIEGVTNRLPKQVIAKAYQDPKYKGRLREILEETVLGEVIKKADVNTYEELYNIAGTLDKNNYDLQRLITNTIGTSEYDTEKISEIIARRMAKTISVHGYPLQYQNLLTVLKNDEERKNIPKFFETERQKLKKELEEKKSNKTVIQNLEKYDEEEMSKKIEEYIKSTKDLKGKSKKEEGIEPGD